MPVGEHIVGPEPVDRLRLVDSAHTAPLRAVRSSTLLARGRAPRTSVALSTQARSMDVTRTSITGAGGGVVPRGGPRWARLVAWDTYCVPE